jgi:hypothetical protein
MRCNVCGDSKTSKRKKRGNIIWDRRRDMVYYKCFNEGDCPVAGDGNAMGGAKWLKTYYPYIYEQYIKELLLRTSDLKKPSKEAPKPLEVAVDATAEVLEEKKATKHFVPITSSGDLCLKAVSYCEKRRIPKDSWSKFFVATDGKYRGRMIIPFYTNTGSIYYYQARDLIGNIPKYLNRKTNRDEAIYGIHQINKEEPVLVTEGPIDSMFCDNAIATLGLSITEEVREKLNGLNCYYLFDNDDAGKEASVKFMNEGKPVFNWSKYLKDNNLKSDEIKDINDLYLKTNRTLKYSFSDFSSYFTTSYYDRVYFAKG